VQGFWVKKKNMMFYVIVVWSWKGQNNNIVIKKQIVSIYTPSIKLTPNLSFSSIKHLIELIALLKTTNNNKNPSAYSILVIGLLVLLIFAKLTPNVNFLFNYTLDWINWNFKHFHLFHFGLWHVNLASFAFNSNSLLNYTPNWINWTSTLYNLFCFNPWSFNYSNYD